MEIELWVEIALGVVAIAGSLVLCRVIPWLGFILSPVLSVVAGVCVAEATGLEAPMILVTTIFTQLLSLVLLATADTREGAPAWPPVLARIVLSILGMLVLLGGVILIGRVVGLVFGIVFFALIIRYWLMARHAWVTHVFTTLQAAMRQNLPLTVALDAEAAGTTGKLRAILVRINYWLLQGLPLSEALRQGYPQCPGFALAQVAAAERIHQLPEGLAQIQAQMQRMAAESRKLQPINPLYPFMLMFFMCLMVGGLTWKIIPQYTAIFRDMRVPVPPLTEFVFYDFAGNMLFLFPVLLPAMLAVAVMWLYASFRPRRAEHPKFLSRVGDFIRWHTPGMSWFEKKNSMLQAITFIRMSLAVDNRVDRAIAEAADLDTNLCYRRRLRKWLVRVQNGQDIAAAARASGVGGGLAWAFDQSANPGQTPRVLEMLETTYRAAYGYKANLVRYIFWPCVTVGMGVIVGAVVLAAFLPLIGMIQSMTARCIP